MGNWLLGSLLILAFTGVQAFAQGSSPTQQLTQAHILISDVEVPPPDSAAWQPQTLPDNWNKTRPGVGGFAWYRVEFDLTAEHIQLSALYVPRISITGSALVNGEFVGGERAFAEPLSRLWYRPQLFVIPAKLLKVGTNTVHIRMKTYPNSKGGLSEMSFGSAAPVEAIWSQRYFWQVTSVQITSAITLGLGIMALLAWSLRGWETAYGYFGAAALVWVLRNSHFLLTQIPVPASYWEVFSATAQIWVLSLVFMFVLRFAGKVMSIAERFILAFSIAAPFILLWVGAERLTLTSNLLYLVMLFMGAYILKVTFDVARRERTTGTILLVGASLVVYGLGAHDWVTHRGDLGFSQPLNLHFGAPILFLVVTWNMFKRFNDAQTQATDLAQSLETRVQQKNTELQQSFELLRAVEAAQAQGQERARIMQDMHDGLGSQLVSSLAMAQSGDLSSAQTYDLLRSCIDDLRLAIDTSNQAEDSLALALGNLRFRMEPRLKAAGILLRWNTQGLSDTLPLPAQAQLPLLRIIQESITNTLKHANAKTLVVNVSNSATELQIDISDDGCGFDVATARQTAQGKGLNSLDKRARVLGAQLEVVSSPQGTRTMLRLPLP
jgi:signal transduction histidine kinase